MNSNVPESSVNALNDHTNSSDGISDRDIERVADFIEQRLFRETGKISKEAARASSLFADRIGDAIVDWEDGDAGYLSRLSLMSYHIAGNELSNISRGVILTIAREYFDEFADAARNLGWIE